VAYTALPDMRMPYDNDGTRVGYNQGTGIIGGVIGWFTGSQLIALNAKDWNSIGAGAEGVWGQQGVWMFYPERREITGMVIWMDKGTTYSWGYLQASADTTNGVDGTWENASLAGGTPDVAYTQFDAWRMMIRPVSFTGSKKVLRWQHYCSYYGGNPSAMHNLHVYGEKAAGQTPDDLIYIDHDTTPGVEFAAAEDFGDRPLATSVIRQFRLKNVSATKTANGINIQLNDADFAISEDGTTWVVTINISSLAAGAQSATLYMRNTTPAIGSLLGPRFARIVTTVASWT